MSVKIVHDTAVFVRNKDVSNTPCPTITIGANSANAGHYKIVIDDRPQPEIEDRSGKPPYRVPTMDEIRAIPWNGFKVASTFSGCGGSCTGYRMAGFRVVWANEFVPIAQESYKANMAEGGILDGRDIRIIQPAEILEATGLQAGELDVFDGSPPCQAFSTAGKREKGWGEKKVYEHGAAQCNETLFGEYIRLVRGLQPKVFIAENVSGLVKGASKGWFIEVMTALKAAGYRVKAKLLDAQWLGVPQARQRIIFIGVREDLGREPVHPKPLPYRYSVIEALPWIVNAGVAAHGFTKENALSPLLPTPTVTTSAGKAAFTGHWVEAEADISGYAIGAEWDRMAPGRQSDKYFQLTKPALNETCGTVTATGGSNQKASVCHPTEKRKFSIAELRRICAFPDDYVLCGTYAQQWERLGNAVPPVMMKAIAEVVRDRILPA